MSNTPEGMRERRDSAAKLLRWVMALFFAVEVDMVETCFEPLRYFKSSKGWNLAEPEESPLSMMRAMVGSFGVDLRRAVL